MPLLPPDGLGLGDVRCRSCPCRCVRAMLLQVQAAASESQAKKFEAELSASTDQGRRLETELLASKHVSRQRKGFLTIFAALPCLLLSRGARVIGTGSPGNRNPRWTQNPYTTSAPDYYACRLTTLLVPDYPIFL